MPRRPSSDCRGERSRGPALQAATPREAEESKQRKEPSDRGGHGGSGGRTGPSSSSESLELLSVFLQALGPPAGDGGAAEVETSRWQQR